MIRSVSNEPMPLDAPHITGENSHTESPSIPAEWLEAQRSLAASTNLALVTIGSHNITIGQAANNTSICESFLAHPEKSRLCAQFCGRAREHALQAGETITYRCHAGLYCFAAPIEINRSSNSLVMIGGRAFVSARDYRQFIEREQQNSVKSDPKLCRNLKFTDEEELKHAAQFILSKAREFFGQNLPPAEVAPPVQALSSAEQSGSQIVKTPEAAAPVAPVAPTEKATAGSLTLEELLSLDDDLLSFEEESSPVTPAPVTLQPATPVPVTPRPAPPAAQTTPPASGTPVTLPAAPPMPVNPPSVRVTVLEPRTAPSNRIPAEFFNGSFDESCREMLRTVGLRYGVRSMSLLIRRGDALLACAASGTQRQRLINARIRPEDSLLTRLNAQSSRPKALSLTDYEIAFLIDDDELAVAEIGDAFPLFIGSQLQGALLIFDAKLDAESRRQILEFGQTVIVPLEMARLRSELREQTLPGTDLRDFASYLATLSDASQIYAEVFRKSVETLGAERASLMTYDEKSQRLTFRESLGLNPDIVKTESLRPGEGIAGVVFEKSEPLLVRDVSQLGASEETRWLAERVRNRRGGDTRSFISYPIKIGDRRLGVLNLTGSNYSPGDLRWLKTIIPQAAIALDRLHLRELAERFQLMSITDPLTGLVNRRYLDERFAEELQRSQRYYYPLSVLMIDIDNFKKWNDDFGHQSGDEVLRAVAQSIRGSLRNFDVAARYGGEEFCIILPETDRDAAAVLAERLRVQVETDFGADNPKLPRAITISVGVAGLSHDLHTTSQIILAADQALYAAKKEGKNCVVVYDDATG